MSEKGKVTVDIIEKPDGGFTLVADKEDPTLTRFLDFLAKHLLIRTPDVQDRSKRH